MSEHKASIAWHSTDQPFTTETYTRQHTWSFDGGVVIPASSAPEYQGDWDRVDPEKGLVASLSSCHMLTFLAVAAKRRIIVTSYEDEAVGTLEKNAEGKI
ncbi:MAG TPA: OsmC family peroxiredoxin, partial [Planctomycetota bacterium]|nr:OsmC family peroxiredoxin [Planctomycetota bacterium]